MKPSEILIAARALITPREAWLNNGSYARTADGEHVYGSSKSAVCFCSMGALQSVLHATDVDISPVLSMLQKAAGDYNIPIWNDNPTHNEVLAGFDRAIALAQQEESVA